MRLGNPHQREAGKVNLQKIALRNLVASGQPRPLVTEDVDKLAASIKEVGLIQPITVKRSVVIHGTAQPGWQIVAGHHRVAACRSLGWSEIDVLVIDDMDHLQSELIEIDENLCRSELSVAQRSKYMKRRQQIWEAMHPGELEVGQLVPLQVSGHGGARPHVKAFAASTAAATGITKRDINRHLSRAEALGDTLDRITGTSLDKGVELDALAKLPEPEREVLVSRAQAGEAVSARQAPRNASRLPTIAASLKKALRHVLDDAGCLSLQELARLVHHEVGKADESDIELICECVDTLEQWAHALQETHPTGAAL